MTEILDAMTRPDSNGTPSLPKRSAPKGLLPSTWLERTLKLEYVDGFGAGVEASGVLLVLPGRPDPECGGSQEADFMGADRLVRLVED